MLHYDTVLQGFYPSLPSMVQHILLLYHTMSGQAELTAGLQHLPDSHSLALQVIDLILLYDGDVMKFAGDSMIVAFSPSKEEQAADDGGLKEATLRCMHCASDLVDKYGEHPITIIYRCFSRLLSTH